MKSKLNIFYEEIKVGEIFYTHDIDKDNFSLLYDDDWIADGFELSNHLPLTSNTHNDSEVRRFISNLIPEGTSLQELAEYYNISKKDNFNLLKTIGKETSGAFSFIEDSDIKNFAKSSFREVGHSELADRIKRRKELPITIWDEKPRISVAGVQEKLPITILNGKYGFGDGKIASTHILKFGKEDYIFNEYLSLLLTRDVGIDVNEVELLKFDNEYAIQVVRFDRVKVSNEYIKKLHLVDGCQMLNLPPEFKYEKVDVRGMEKVGANFKSIFELSLLTNTPIEAKNKIIDWILVNLCLANADAHAKNISFLYSKDGIELAPFYDIMNISLLSHKFRDDLAMGIGDEFKILDIKPYDLKEFAKENNISLKHLKDRFDYISSKIVECLENQEDYGFINDFDKETFYKEYKDNTLHRMRKLQEEFHYLLFPEQVKFNAYIRQNKKSIDKLITEDEKKNKSDGEIIDLYFEKKRPLNIPCQ